MSKLLGLGLHKTASHMTKERKAKGKPKSTDQMELL